MEYGNKQRNSQTHMMFVALLNESKRKTKEELNAKDEWKTSCTNKYIDTFKYTSFFD
jgi:hypothetical protein